MDGLGERLRARARELGWSDAAVARRVGIAQTRFANYITDRHEPDLATFVRICAVLSLSPTELLLPAGHVESARSALRERIASSAAALDDHSLGVLATVAEGLVARSIPSGEE